MFQKTRILCPLCVAVLSVALGTPAAAQAQGRPSGPPQGQPDSFTYGLGVGVAPRFPGADSYAPLPFPLINWVKNGRTLRNNGFGVEYDVTKGTKLDFGPILRINGGRDDLNNANDAVIEALGQVSLTAEVGAFIATTRPISTSRQGPPLLFTARASFVQAISGHDGFLIEGAVGLVRPSRKWTTSVSATATVASGNYQDAFFSVNSAQSLASGLAEFDADAGLRDVGVTSFIRYAINPKWSVNTIASYSRLVSDAADSPIVTERGSANQAFFGLNVAYTWR